MLCDIIDLFEVLNPIEHLNNFVIGFLCNRFALMVDVLVKLLQITRCEFSIALDLLHKIVSKDGHLMLGLHDLLEINEVRNISNNEKFVLTASHVHINLIQGYVLLADRSSSCFLLIELGNKRQFKCGALLVFG